MYQLSIAGLYQFTSAADSLGYAVRDAAENMLVPPIRPIPPASKASYLVGGNSPWVQYDGKDCWKALAESVTDKIASQTIVNGSNKDNSTVEAISAKQLAEMLISEMAGKTPDVSEGEALLEYVNRILTDPRFLETR